MPEAPADRVIGLYEENAGIWAGQRDSSLFERGWLERFLENLPGARRRVVDLGCGTGTPIARYLVGQSCRVTGVDAAASMIERARAAFPTENWIVADMRDLPALGAFDGVIAWHSFFHLSADDQRPMFATFRRLAAPGAALIFTSGPKAGEAIGRMAGEPLFHASLDPDEYRGLLRDKGFAVVRHVAEDADCGGATVWLAKREGAGRPEPQGYVV